MASDCDTRNILQGSFVISFARYTNTTRLLRKVQKTDWSIEEFQICPDMQQIFSCQSVNVWSLENISTYSKFQPGPMSGRTTRSPGHRKVSLGSRRGELRWWTAVTVAASHDVIQLENTEAAWNNLWYSGLWVVRPLFLKPKSWNRTERWNPGTCCWVQLSWFMMCHESVISILIVVSSVFLNLQAKEHFLERGCYMPCAGWNRIP